MELLKYQEDIKMMADEKSDKIFSCVDTTKKSIILTEMINNSKNIRIYNNVLSNKIFNFYQFILNLSKFLDNGGIITLVVRDSNYIENSFIEYIKDFKSYKKYKEQFIIKNLSANIKGFNFILMDDNKYIIDIDEMGNSLVCFDDTKNTQLYKNVFDEIEKISTFFDL